MGKVLDPSIQGLPMSGFDKFKYFVHFITRAFLLAIFVLFFILFIFFFCYFADLIYNMKAGNAKTPLFGAYIIVSPSMVPTIQVNDAIVIRRIDDMKLEVGDIITFSSSDPNYSGLTVTHRIVGKQLAQTGEYVYRTKGDNNRVDDATLVKADSIYGKVILKIPKLGYIQQFLTTSYGFILVVLIPALGVVVYDIIKFIKMITEKIRIKLKGKDYQNNLDVNSD